MSEIITGLRNLTTTLAEILDGNDRVASLQTEQRRLSEQIDGELAQIRQKCKGIQHFLDGESPDSTPQEKSMGELLHTRKLPANEPRQMYERIKAILEASIDPEGINFPDIETAYQKLKWRDWDDEALPQKIRDAIKNLRKQLGTKLSHSGERRGKYKIT